MKALEKDRTRRYEAASALARDVERYMQHEPVEAGPPSRRYRLGKFLRRHRVEAVDRAAGLGLLVAAPRSAPGRPCGRRGPRRPPRR